MAQTRRIPVFGSRPPCAKQSRLYEHTLQLQKARMQPLNNSNKPADFVAYEDSDDEEESKMSLYNMLNSSNNFVDYIRYREYGMREYRSINKNYGTRHILTNNLFKEYPIPLNYMDKAFCSQWLDSKQIIFGTKCNKLMVYDTNSHELVQIPCIKGRVDENENENEESGIHTLKINPSRTLLATDAYNSNEVAVYRLPSLEPIALAEGAHEDWLFDVEWLDDEFFVSGSRDTKLALWKFQEQYEENYDTDGNLIQPVKQFLKPTVLRSCKQKERVRAIIFNKHLKELVTLSLNGFVHLWDVEYFKQRFSYKLSPCQDTVCMAQKDDGRLFAVGSRTHTLLHDSRTLNSINKIPARYSQMNGACSVRSLSFQGDVITIGTGIGVIMFYDTRAGKFFETTSSNKSVVLKTSRGYYSGEEEDFPDAILDRGYVIQPPYAPAIYTHCYDYSGTRLFSAGGPLKTNMTGSYTSLWQ